MARIRSVHPGLFTDEHFVACGAWARLLLIGIWTEADDQGVFEWKPIRLKMRLFPADDVDVADLLEELVVGDFLHFYEIEGREYGAVRNFRKFQRPKSPKAIHPLPPDFRNYVGLTPISGEVVALKPGAFPQKGEMSPQMEEIR